MDHRYYSEPLRQVVEHLETDPDRGLSTQEARRRLDRFGENQLDQAKPPGLLIRCLAQLKDPMILVLLGAAGLSLLAGGSREILDTAIILLIVAFNTVISVSQEDNARKALEVAAGIPHDRIVIETDCPYMAPEPFRGKRNHPGYIYRMAEKLAELWELPVEEVRAITTENGKQLYRI